jgi:hypothetical protein
MGKMGSIRGKRFISNRTSHQTKATQLNADITNAETMAVLPHVNAWDPACCIAKTRKPELLSRVILPTKSMLVNALQEKI